MGGSLETDRATSLIYIIFLLVTHFDVFAIYEREVSALERMSLLVDHLLVCGCCSPFWQLSWQEVGKLLAMCILLFCSCSDL